MKSAIFTLEHQEQWFLPMWIKYYSQFFAPEDMYILAHNSDKIDTDCNVGYLNTDEIFNHDWLLNVIHNKQRELLTKYDYVVFTDCDEFIVPKVGTLREFIDKATDEAYRCQGYDVVEDKMFASHGFSKTLISRVPLTWCHGYHFTTPEYPIHPELELYHMHFLSYKECWDRCQRLAKEQWDKSAVDNRLGWQNRITDETEFRKSFYANRDNFIDQSPNLTKLLNNIKYTYE